MATVSHRIEFFLAQFGILTANLFSTRSADSFGRMLGSFGYHILAKRRNIAVENLKNSFGDAYTDKEYRLITKKTFQSIGQTFVELARFPKSNLEMIRETITPDGVEYLKEAENHGNGGIIVTSHFGNWEKAAAWVVAQGFELDVIAKVQSNPYVDSLITGLREKLGVKVIQVKQSTLRDIIKALHANKMIAFVADQHDPSGNLVLDFFGRPASVARGPASFARKQNCPVLPYLMRRIGVDRHQIIAHRPIYPDFELDEERDVKRMTIEYLRFFEDNIRKYPDQWMWTHRRWKIKSN